MTKKLISLCVAVVLAVPVLAWTQATSQSSDQQNAQSQPSTQSQGTNQNQSDHNKHGKKQKMAGKVSNNGKTFTNDQDSKNYTVDNPSALQGQEGQHVSVIVGVDPDTGTIHIIQVAAPGSPQ
jgi:hypothetical protein